MHEHTQPSVILFWPTSHCTSIEFLTQIGRDRQPCGQALTLPECAITADSGLGYYVPRGPTFYHYEIGKTPKKKNTPNFAQQAPGNELFVPVNAVIYSRQFELVGVRNANSPLTLNPSFICTLTHHGHCSFWRGCWGIRWYVPSSRKIASYLIGVDTLGAAFIGFGELSDPSPIPLSDKIRH